MADKLQQSLESTVQDTPKKEDYGGLSLVRWMSKAGHYVSPWWSEKRDTDLRKFWKKSDHLSGAIYSMVSKINSIPFTVIPQNVGDRKEYDKAFKLVEDIESNSQFGDGWQMLLSKWLEDYLTTDNGAFAEVIGEGDPAGPIIGKPISVAHLDSSRCQRTGNAEYPVLYRSSSGKLHKMHFSRVMFASQMTSPIEDKLGVGFCAVSRCINVAQVLVDILTYEQEKLGSRPHRAILIAKGGLEPQDVAAAFQLAEQSMDSQGLSRYSKVVLTGAASMPEASIEKVELSSLPDGFNEETSIQLGMAAIALAFGVDARELFPAMGSGATRADAMLQHIKQRGKGPGQILQVIEQLFNYKYLPSSMKLVFDLQDDAQDRQEAEISKIRADRRVQDVESGAINVRITRELMLEDKEITRRQFERLELEDGRLSDGAPVIALFYADSGEYEDWLDVGTTDPLDKESNDEKAMLQIIRDRFAQVSVILAKESGNLSKIDKAMEALAALTLLDEYYRSPEEMSLAELFTGKEEELDPKADDPRVRTQDNLTPNDNNEVNSESTREHPDDKVE
jgi:hypothetical protein